MSLKLLKKIESQFPDKRYHPHPGGFSILIFSSMSSRKSMYKAHPSGSAHPP